MPIYEFYSPDTNRIYSFLARSLAEGRNTPRCPDDPKAKMERMVSSFAVTGLAQEKADPADAVDPHDPRMERAMFEMEREMASMDQNNPDPRHLGRMIRKLAETSGQKMPREMRQMIDRLERGESPEKLEAEFGESLESLGENMDQAAKEVLARLKPKAPKRDPKLYEMREYLD